MARLAQSEDLLLCAKRSFVAAMVAWVHPGLPGIGKSSMMAGKSALHSLCRPLGIVALQSLLQC